MQLKKECMQLKTRVRVRVRMFFAKSTDIRRIAASIVHGWTSSMLIGRNTREGQLEANSVDAF